MGTKFSDFMKEIEQEAVAEGPEAVEELCLMRKHFAEQLNKPEAQRCYYAYLSCPCSRCSPGKL
jgi:hypothetical protein